MRPPCGASHKVWAQQADWQGRVNHPGQSAKGLTQLEYGRTDVHGRELNWRERVCFLQMVLPESHDHARACTEDSLESNPSWDRDWQVGARQFSEPLRVMSKSNTAFMWAFLIDFFRNSGYFIKKDICWVKISEVQGSSKGQRMFKRQLSWLPVTKCHWLWSHDDKCVQSKERTPVSAHSQINPVPL